MSEIIFLADKELERLIKEIPEAGQMKHLTIQATELEVDNDRNHHIEYIMAAANLRADNYNLPNITTYKVLLITQELIIVNHFPPSQFLLDWITLFPDIYQLNTGKYLIKPTSMMCQIENKHHNIANKTNRYDVPNRK